MSLFSQKKHSELVAIDFTASTLKIAQVRNSATGKREVVKLLSRDISGASDEAIIKALKSLYAQVKAHNPVIINIMPAAQVISKNIEVPSTNPEEIREIINLQAGRHTPYSREEILIDYLDIDIFKQSYTKILLVIVTRQVAKRQFEILQKAGLKTENIVFAAEAVAKSGTRLFKQENQAFPFCLVNVDDLSSDYMVVFKNKILYTRVIPIGANHLSGEKEKYQPKFAEELKKSLEAYQVEDVERMPVQMILSGVDYNWADLEIILNDAVRLPTQAAQYLKSAANKDVLEKAIAAPSRVSYLAMISALLHYEELKVSFIPEDVRMRRALEQRGKEVIKTGMFVLFIFLLVFFILTANIYFKNLYLAGLSKKYQPIRSEAQQLENNFAEISLVRSYLAQRGYSLETLNELYAVTPLEIEYSDIRYDEQGRFSIKGTAESMSVVFGFVDTLEKSKYFKDVKTKYTTKRKEGSRDVTDFEIAATLERARNAD